MKSKSRQVKSKSNSDIAEALKELNYWKDNYIVLCEIHRRVRKRMMFLKDRLNDGNNKNLN